ncbi:MAG: aminopeptidase [Pseudonocardiales bacterium]|nr:MAG: aminopeptidase [Pseudonocardiales bacterium]
MSKDGSLRNEDLELYRKGFATNPAYRLAQNAVTQVSIDDVALERDIVTSIDPTVSHLIDDWKVTNQKQTGRCWMFAGLNLLRHGAMAAMNLKDFEFSQNYTMFWDKLERANYFLEAIIETADRDADDRTVGFLLDSVLGDGGQWNMFVALIDKHGLVPKSAMPETESSSKTARMNGVLRSVLRQAARDLRDLDSVDARRDNKADVIGVVHRILCIHLGTPPESFGWQWTDKDREFHRDGEITPQQFAQRYVTIPIDDYVCLVDDPRPESPKGRTFTVDYLGNIVGGPRVIYLNVEMAALKSVAKDAIVGGEPVWFGCDVGKMMRRDLGIWDAKLFDYAGLYDTSFTLDKAARLTYHETQMTHAMLFTGVDVDDGAARKWRVENSWGDENGVKGFYTMNDSWFDEYVFEIAARKSALPAALQAALGEEPIVLPAWDPMGALAG